MVDFHLTTGSITDHEETKRFGHARVIDMVPRTTTTGSEDMPTCHRRFHSTEVPQRSAGDDSLTESFSGKSSHDEDYYENTFDMNDCVRGKPSPVITMPIVVEVIPRRGHYYSDDPLFQGVCLYNGCMTDTQREELDYKVSIEQNKEAHPRGAAPSGRLSSIFSSIFWGHA